MQPTTITRPHYLTGLEIRVETAAGMPAPLPGDRARVIDAESGRELPARVIGVSLNGRFYELRIERD